MILNKVKNRGQNCDFAALWRTLQNRNYLNGWSINPPQRGGGGKEHRQPKRAGATLKNFFFKIPIKPQNQTFIYF